MIILSSKRNRLEYSLFNTISVLAFSGSLIWFIMLTPLELVTKIILIILGLIFVQIFSYVILPFVLKEETLKIDTENKTFSIGDQNFVDYSKLKNFEGKTVGNWGTAASKAYASMYITLTHDGKKFKTNDDDAAKNFTPEGLTAFNEMILGSGLTEVNQQRLLGWVEGVKIRQQPRRKNN